MGGDGAVGLSGYQLQQHNMGAFLNFYTRHIGQKICAR